GRILAETSTWSAHRQARRLDQTRDRRSDHRTTAPDRFASDVADELPTRSHSDPPPAVIVSEWAAPHCPRDEQQGRGEPTRRASGNPTHSGLPETRATIDHVRPIT